MVHNDVAELYYQFIGAEWEVAAEKVKVARRRETRRARRYAPGDMDRYTEKTNTGRRSYYLEMNHAGLYLSGDGYFSYFTVPQAVHQTNKTAPGYFSRGRAVSRTANREREEAKAS